MLLDPAPRLFWISEHHAIRQSCAASEGLMQGRGSAGKPREAAGIEEGTMQVRARDHHVGEVPVSGSQACLEDQVFPEAAPAA
jgi:hypothetical protein